MLISVLLVPTKSLKLSISDSKHTGIALGAEGWIHPASARIAESSWGHCYSQPQSLWTDLLGEKSGGSTFQWIKPADALLIWFPKFRFLYSFFLQWNWFFFFFFFFCNDSFYSLNSCCHICVPIWSTWSAIGAGQTWSVEIITLIMGEILLEQPNQARVKAVFLFNYSNQHMQILSLEWPETCGTSLGWDG